MKTFASCVAAVVMTLGCGNDSWAQLQAVGDPDNILKEGGMVVTVLEARVAPDREGDLLREYGGPVGELPPFIVESFLLRGRDSEVWRIMTVWRSSEELDDYRASVETPEGVRIFRAAGSEPTLTIFDVAAHATR